MKCWQIGVGKRERFHPLLRDFFCAEKVELAIFLLYLQHQLTK